MNININKDFVEVYKDEFYRGFSVKEIICIIASLIFAIASIYALWRLTGWKVDICVYFIVPLMLPVLAIGFFKYQGLSILELLQEIKYERRTAQLTYAAEELDQEDKVVFLTTVAADNK